MFSLQEFYTHGMELRCGRQIIILDVYKSIFLLLFPIPNYMLLLFFFFVSLIKILRKKMIFEEVMLLQEMELGQILLGAGQVFWIWASWSLQRAKKYSRPLDMMHAIFVNFIVCTFMNPNPFSTTYKTFSIFIFLFLIEIHMLLCFSFHYKSPKCLQINYIVSWFIIQ